MIRNHESADQKVNTASIIKRTSLQWTTNLCSPAACRRPCRVERWTLLQLQFS